MSAIERDVVTSEARQTGLTGIAAAEAEIRDLRALLAKQTKQAWVDSLRWAARCVEMDAENVAYAASVSRLPGAEERIFVLRNTVANLRTKADAIEAGREPVPT